VFRTAWTSSVKRGMRSAQHGACYVADGGDTYLNLIDTPGHVDFECSAATDTVQKDDTVLTHF
jgi:translation elongation factor EF-G